ncbi:sugar phosphate isomerase/epimerase family protein [Halomonas organivorans]|uniref:Sugar phosphate isomerase/epimerase n=1 Tax=Halomonas organivorans TaxID=257772 RepID=A0A7W5BZC6_9GAMM|nr:sugar phosphate isomerase/epimerase family protein [Halomonas organivorans]MBB3141870.1 sugar phosphate isomerase/epimerase [Halomonas organivorans]
MPFEMHSASAAPNAPFPSADIDHDIITSQQEKSVNIGIRAHDLKTQPLDDLVADIAQRGLGSVQLAPSKSFDIPAHPGSLTPGLAHRIASAFRRQDVQIAVLGCYVNIIHPDPDERRRALNRFKEHLRHARDFGCGIVGTETGNVNADIIYTEENFHEAPLTAVIDSVRELVDEAERFGVVVGIEPGVNHPIYSPETVRRLLDSVDSPNLQIIFDPVNFLTIDNYERQRDIFREAFDSWGDRIAVMHAKDVRVAGGALKPAAVGQGLLDYAFLFEWLAPRKPNLNVILDEVELSDLEEIMAFLNRFRPDFARL